MSCSGQHFSVHSPDCKAHLSIQSNRPLQVEPAGETASVSQLDVCQTHAPSPAGVARAWSSSPARGQQEARCQSGELLRHVAEQDENNSYTLLILDCSPHPHAEEGLTGSAATTNCESACYSTDCAHRCHCQTELIVRQQIEHDHSCQHQGQHLLCGSGSLADRSASQTSTRSQETLPSQRAPLVALQESPAARQSRSSSSRQTSTTSQRDESTRHFGHANDENWPQAGDQQQPAAPTSDDQEASQLERRRHESPQARRPGTKIVKRWNWNQAQFVEEEVTERPRTLPLAPDVPTAGSPARLRPPADAWNQELQSLSSALSPTPLVHYDPSWLAYRKPDEASVQADSLYQDLMQELRLLEEGVALGGTQTEPASTPECQQRPVWGQALQPASVELEEYANAEFLGRLIPNSDATMRVEWTKDGRPLLESSRLTSEYEFGVVRLLIRRCEAEDSGLYECRAVNQLGEARSSARLLVHAKGNVQCESLHPAGMEQIRRLENPPALQVAEEAPVCQAPKFLTHIQDYAEKEEGESVHFECCLAPVDDADMRTEWFFNGRPLVTGSRFHTIDDFGFIVLDIDWLFPRDTGEYICRASNKWGSDFTRTVLRVRPAKNIVLDSQLAENAAATIDKLRQLEFPEAPAELAVEELSRPAHFVQPLRTAGQRQHFTEGDNVHFEARAGPASDGQLTVEWFHEGRPLIAGHRFKPTFDFGHILLDILYLYPEDSGVYRCVARNGQGEAASEWRIEVAGKQSIVYQSQLPKEMEGGVQKITDMEAAWNRPAEPEEEEAPAARVPPEFVLAPKDCLAFEGSCARFCCRIVGQPRPRVAWFINGQLVVSGSRYKLTHDGMYHLIIPKCQLTDAGCVRVAARNLLGECARDARLQVRRKVDDYRGVLKNSPNPWYDEQTLRLYRRQRNQTDEDEAESEDFEEFLLNFQRARQQQQQQQGSRGLSLQGLECQASGQLVGYMEPGTPDVNLLAAREPLVEPGDMHPSVLEQQATKSPAPSTVGRALSDKDKLPSPPDMRGAPGEPADKTQQRVFGLISTRRNQSSSQREQQSSNTTNISINDIDNNNNNRQQQQQQQQQQRQLQRVETRQEESTRLQTTGENKRRPAGPPASPENVEHGKEIHSHFHKQLQVERHANREIMREIIEKETFEQEHRGFSKDNLVRGESEERHSATPMPAVSWAVQRDKREETSELPEEQMEPPEFITKIQPCQAIEGDEARFECAFRGKPRPNISWFREDKPIRASNLYAIETDLEAGRSTLVIRRATLAGDAVYTVKAENAAGSAKSSANLVVEAHPLPSASRGGQARQFDALEHLGRQSDVRGFSPADSSSDYSSVLLEGESLERPKEQRIKSVRTRRLSPDQLGSMLRASPDGQLAAAPAFLHLLNEQHVRPGELVRLDARLVGSQPLEVRWLKDGQRVRADRQHKLLLEGDLYTLLILESSPADAGFYECVASNRVGEARCGASLRVSADGRHSASALAESSEWRASPATGDEQQARQHFGLTSLPHHRLMSEYTSAHQAARPPDQEARAAAQIPKLIKGLESQQVREGKSVTLRCQISAHPKAEVSWFKQGDRPIKPSKYFRIFKDNDETHCLRILETFAEDQGEYKCVARAQHGQLETSATVLVLPGSPR